MRLLQCGAGSFDDSLSAGDQTGDFAFALSGIGGSVCVAGDPGKPERLAAFGGMHGDVYSFGQKAENGTEEDMCSSGRFFPGYAPDGASDEAAGRKGGDCG